MDESKIIDCEKLYKSYNDGIFKRHAKEDKYSLANISFNVKRGECIAIIGRNGSGKSTLMKILANQLSPTSGRVEINAQVNSLIELGTGLDLMQSGEENVKFFLGLLGYQSSALLSWLEMIRDFADVGDYFYQPVKTYSSGMFVRLAYAMRALLPCDVLIVDEALAVGDIKFQHKCFAHIGSLLRSGTSILLVTHSIEQIRQLCSRVILIDDGHILFDGDASLGCDKYLNMLYTSPVISDGIDSEVLLEVDQNSLSNIPLLNTLSHRYGANQTIISDVQLYADGKLVKGRISENYQEMRIRISGNRNTEDNLVVGFGIKSVEGVIIYATNNFIDGAVLNWDLNKQQFQCDISINSCLRAGAYFIDVGICRDDGTTGGDPLDVIPSCLILEIESYRLMLNDGFLNPKIRYECK